MRKWISELKTMCAIGVDNTEITIPRVVGVEVVEGEEPSEEITCIVSGKYGSPYSGRKMTYRYIDGCIFLKHGETKKLSRVNIGSDGFYNINPKAPKVYSEKHFYNIINIWKKWSNWNVEVKV